MRGKPKTKITRKTLRRKRLQALAFMSEFLTNSRPPSNLALAHAMVRRPAPPEPAVSLLARLGLA